MTSASPASAITIPATTSGVGIGLGHRNTPSARKTAAIRTSWATPQPPPLLAELDEAGVVEALRTQSVLELLRRRRVDRERHQGLAASARARDGHVRDVHPGVAEERAHAADHARHVVVAEEDHERAQLHLDAD